MTKNKLSLALYIIIYSHTIYLHESYHLYDTNLKSKVLKVHQSIWNEIVFITICSKFRGVNWWNISKNVKTLLYLFPTCYVLHFYCYACGYWLFLSLGLLVYSMVLLWMLWICTLTIQQRWSFFVHILCGLLLYRCYPIFK